MNRREFVKKSKDSAIKMVCGMILTLLPQQVFAAAIGGEQETLQKVTLNNRADLYIRDPFILPDSATKTYYLYKSMNVELKSGQSRAGVVVYVGRDLQTWEGPTPVFHLPDGFWADRSVWAPEVHQYKGKYYLFVTFTSKHELPTPEGRPQNVKRGTQILVADSPTEPFEPFANKPHTPEDWMSLDGTLWVEEGVPYMVFCHEWWQVTDGTMELVRLKGNLSDVIGKPKTLFKATDAEWVKSLRDIGSKRHGYVTDGPFLYRTKSGRLLMIWSSFGPDKYTVGLARSTTDRLAGPWKQIDEPLLAADGGHGMILRTFDGKLVMAIHQPNSGDIRAHLFELDDTGESLSVKRELSLLGHEK
ncbi:MAG: glycoside hydrolase family 43 protein [Planctomycetota bacterium]|jgi:GH43 family beta-xylosidase